MLTEDNGVGFQGFSEAQRKQLAIASRTYECKKCSFLIKSGDKSRAIQMQEIEALYMVDSKDWSKTKAAPANNFFSQGTPVSQPKRERETNLNPMTQDAQDKGIQHHTKDDVNPGQKEEINVNPPAAVMDFKVVTQDPRQQNEIPKKQEKRKKEKTCQLI